MSLSRYKASNHPQQTRLRGPNDEVDDRATHPLDFAEFAERHGPFDLDVAAAAHNTKCERFYTREQDGLSLDWGGSRIWCNPPYSDIAPWVAKAWKASARAELIAMLLPANRTEQQWWQQMVEPYRDRDGSPLRTEFLSGRRRFLARGQTAIGPNERPPFGCVLLIWRKRSVADSALWRPDRVVGGLFGEVRDV